MSNFQQPIYLPDLNALQWVQGSPSEFTHRKRLMVLIQPNCPGCLKHAVPVLNDLYQSKQNFDMYCVSTAFEDFQYNTVENIAGLIRDGLLVGDSKIAFGDDDIAPIRSIPLLPVAHDVVIPKEDATKELLDLALEATKQSAREQLLSSSTKQLSSPNHSIHPGVLEKHLSQLGYDVLPERIAQIFWTVRASGTPMWVVHNSDNNEVLGRRFGVQTKESIVSWIEEL